MGELGQLAARQLELIRERLRQWDDVSDFEWTFILERWHAPLLESALDRVTYRRQRRGVWVRTGEAPRTQCPAEFALDLPRRYG